MQVRHCKVASATLTATLVATLICQSPTFSADLGPGQGSSPHPIYEPQAQVHRQFYVRGDVGVGRHQIGKFSQAELGDNGGSFLVSSIDDTFYVGAGIGAKINPRFRFDLTGEYRGSAQVRALDNVTATLSSPAGTLQANTSYSGSMTSYVGLLNGYWDLFTMRGITPYVGAGIGFAHNRASGFTTASSATFTDLAGTPTLELTNGHSAATAKTNLAWALMAGASFDLNERSKLDIGYRYLDLGSGASLTTGLLNCVCGTIGSPLKVSDLSAHEVRVGLRWAFDAPQGGQSYRPMK